MRKVGNLLGGRREVGHLVVGRDKSSQRNIDFEEGSHDREGGKDDWSQPRRRAGEQSPANADFDVGLEPSCYSASAPPPPSFG